MSKTHIHSLMAELGPLLEPLEIAAMEEEGIWTVTTDETTTLFFDYDEAGDRLTLSAEVGRPEDDARERVYQTLLSHNQQWRASGGIRLGLDEPGGNVVQIHDLPASNPDLASLQGTIAAFLEALEKWRDYLGEVSETDTSPNTRIDDPRLPGGGGMIRG